MARKKDVVINVDPLYVESRSFEDGFELRATCPMKSGNRRKIIKMKFKRWQVVYLASELKKIIDFEKEELARIVDLVGFKDGEA